MPVEGKQIVVSAVLFQEDDWWCAQCLEYDLATQAKTLLDLRSELERVLVSHLALAEELQRDPFAALPSAPQRFWDMYRTGKPIPRSETRYWATNDTALPPIEPRLRVA